MVVVVVLVVRDGGGEGAWRTGLYMKFMYESGKSRVGWGGGAEYGVWMYTGEYSVKMCIYT